MRFKFTCTCGKRLAAYSWMVGKVTECPKCNTTMTIPTPERAAEMRGARGEDLATRYRLKGPAPAPRSVSEYVLVALVMVLSLAVGAVLGCLHFFGQLHFNLFR